MSYHPYTTTSIYLRQLEETLNSIAEQQQIEISKKALSYPEASAEIILDEEWTDRFYKREDETIEQWWERLPEPEF